MSTDPNAGMQQPGGSTADIQPNTNTDNLQDADTLAAMKNADPDMPDIADEDLNADMNEDARVSDALPRHTPITDEDQLYNTSDVLDGGTNSSDLGAEQAGLTDPDMKDSDAGLYTSGARGDNPTGDRATGLGAFKE